MTTVKTLITGTAIVALVAGSAFAQSNTSEDSTAIPPVTQPGAVAPQVPSADQGDTTADGGDALAPMNDDANETADTGEAVPLTTEGAENPPLAAENTEEPIVPSITDPMTTAGDRPMTVGQVIGMNVVGAEDESVGEIDYVVQEGDTLAAVIGVGGFLGLGEYTVQLPMSDFEVIDEGNLRLASLTREQLKQMPEVDESSLRPLPDDMVVGDEF